MNNAHKLPVKPVIRTTYETDIVKTIEDAVREAVTAGEQLKHIAKCAGVCTTTLSKLYYGETRFPRMATISGILNALGYKLYAMKSVD